MDGVQLHRQRAGRGASAFVAAGRAEAGVLNASVWDKLVEAKNPNAAKVRVLATTAPASLAGAPQLYPEPLRDEMTTLGGRGIRGAVVGSGDLPIGRLLGLVAASGFDGPVSIEYEGLEDPLTGFTAGLAAAQRLAAEAVR